MPPLDERMRAGLAPFFSDLSSRWLIGFSGGGDSMALVTALLAQGLQERIILGHFNHLWSDWGHEAERWVRDYALAHNLPLIVGQDVEKYDKNLEARARDVRYAFFKHACDMNGLRGVLIAHTRTDVAESFLIRAGKGSGLKGLSAMHADVFVEGVRVGRPFLGFGREELRLYLKGLDQEWLDDPETISQRSRLRHIWEDIEKSGVSEHGLAASAAALERAETALSALLAPLIEATVTHHEGRGDVSILRSVFRDYPEEIGCRMLAHAQQVLLPGTMIARTQQRLALRLRICNEVGGKAMLGGVTYVWDATCVVARRG